MSLFDSQDAARVRAIIRLAYSNPFLSERIEAERDALGDEFDPAGADWNLRGGGGERITPNLDVLRQHAAQLVEKARMRLAEPERRGTEELALYEGLAFFHLYHSYRSAIQEAMRPGRGRKCPFYREFADDYDKWLRPARVRLPAAPDAPHTFAIFCNLFRAFDQIFRHIIGRSEVASRLRADVWLSIFTHDLLRYTRVLYKQMHDITCLITGPSGTGKELVARAVSFSRYIPFDEKSLSFVEDFEGGFHPVQLSSLSSTLIESELFGHRRGAFTGATDDHAGYFEVCGPHGSVFLDEIGETERSVQVKLLRVLQYRTFQRLGDTSPLRFEGKIIAATNRDLAREMSEGRFREDLYYRICSDMIATRPLCEQVSDSEEELRNLVSFIAAREVGDESAALADEVMEVIRKNLGLTYGWPGNFRELEQCVRNVLVRRDYQPARISHGGFVERLIDEMRDGAVTAEDTIRRYATWVYSRTRNYEEVARRLSLDRRTVKSKIDTGLLEELMQSKQVVAAGDAGTNKEND